MAPGQSRIESHRPDLRPAPARLLRSPGGQQQPAAERVDVAGAEREQHVAVAQRGAQVGLGLVEARQPRDRAPAGGVGGRGGDEPARDAGEVLRALARRVDRRARRRRRRARARRRTRAPVCRVRENRCGWKAATMRRAPSVRAASIVARDLRRVVGVVVDHERARGRRAEPLEAPAGAREVRPARRRPRPRSAPASRQAVSAAAALRALWAPGTDSSTSTPSSVEARAALPQLRRRDVERRQRGVAGEREQLGPVPDDGLLGQRQERAEGVVDVAARAVGRVVVELGVREHGDPRRELQQRAVGLVGLDHEPLPLPPAGVGAGRADLAADQVARVHPAAAQGVHDHARGRRLAVGAADRDRRLQPRELAEQLGAVQLALAALAGDRPLGVLGRDRARDHDLGALRHVGGVVALGRLDPERAQRREVGRAGRAVGAGDRRAERAGDERQAAHAGAADADEVQRAAAPWLGRAHGRRT